MLFLFLKNCKNKTTKKRGAAIPEFLCSSMTTFLCSCELREMLEPKPSPRSTLTRFVCLPLVKNLLLCCCCCSWRTVPAARGINGTCIAPSRDDGYTRPNSLESFQQDMKKKQLGTGYTKIHVSCCCRSVVFSFIYSK